MFNHENWNFLQMFAGEGAGGGSAGTGSAGGDGAASGSATGETAADAGQQRLRELGVPENKIRKPRAKKASPLPDGAYRTEQQVQKPTEQVAAAETTNAQTEQKPSTRMSWEEVKNDPEYNAQIQEIVKQRVKDGDTNRAILETLAPALKHLAQEQGLDPENIDYAALVKSITGEYEDKALEMGVSKETVMKLDQQQRTLEQQKFQNHIQKLEQQAEGMKVTFPNFDLRAEMQNPVFARLTSPYINMSVEDAYYAVHRKEIQAKSDQVIANKTAQMVSNAIQSGSRRPDESGAASQAPSVSTFDYRKASPAQRNALKAEIRRAAARGEKIYPGR